jgi:phosphopantothenoylcysteine decarboxylase/phosphopantothenate--cysteine ligase
MGLSLVHSLLDRGAKVHLVMGPTHLPLPAHDHLNVYRVISAAEMAAKVMKLWPDCQVAILAAAVADYTPVHRADQKIKKTENHLTLELVRTEDIAAAIGQSKKSHQISIGFALETELEEEHAQKKLIKKNFDFIVLNSLNDPGAGFQYDTNKITILQASGEIMTFPLKSKTEVAEDIVDVMEKHIRQKKQL